MATAFEKNGYGYVRVWTKASKLTFDLAFDANTFELIHICVSLIDLY